MRRSRRLLCVVFAVAIVTATVHWTGVFSSLGAERTSTVEVVSDTDALVSITPSEGPNGAYAEVSGGTAAVNLNGGLGSGGGLNPDADTRLDNIFVITNQGAGPVEVWLEDGSAAVTFQTPAGDSLESESSAVTLAPRDTVKVGVQVSTAGRSGSGSLTESVTLHANAAVDASSADAPSGGDNPGDDSGRSDGAAEQPVQV